MKEISSKSKTSNKTIKLITIILAVIIIYIFTGLVLGYVGLRLTCRNPLYTCISLHDYMTDPWLLLNTIFWPMTFWSGLEKSNIL